MATTKEPLALSRQDEARTLIRASVHLAHDQCHLLLDLPLSSAQRRLIEVLSELLDLPDAFTNSASWDTGELFSWDAAELGRAWEHKLAWRLPR